MVNKDGSPFYYITIVVVKSPQYFHCLYKEFGCRSLVLTGDLKIFLNFKPNLETQMEVSQLLDFFQ